MKLFIALMLISTSLFADTYVRGYYKRNGSYVKGHYRSKPDTSYNNNWSTKYNVNPYTGKIGTKRRKYESTYDTYKPRKRKAKKSIYGW